MREGLLAVGAGLQVMASLMVADVAAVCGPAGNTTSSGPRCATAASAVRVTLGGRRVGAARPRMRVAGGGEVPVPAYELVSESEILGRMAMSKILAGLSSRHCAVGLEPVRENVERAASGTSKFIPVIV
jgi:putative transposase